MPPPSNAPSAVGAHSAPSSPSQPITCARQWIASAVAAAPVANAPANASGDRDEVVDGAGDDERAEQAGDADRRRGQRGLGLALALAQPHARAEQARRRATPASAVRAPSPIHPLEIAIVSRKASPARTAMPPSQASRLPPTKSSRSRARRGGGRERGRDGGARGAHRGDGAGRGAGATTRAAGVARVVDPARAAGVARPLVGRRALVPALPLVPQRRDAVLDHSAPSVDHRLIAHHTPLLTDGYQVVDRWSANVRVVTPEPAYTRLDVDERRRRLLELGADLFTRFAYDELSMAKIAKEAGISKALLYHYFPSKEAYFVATLEEKAEELARARRRTRRCRRSSSSPARSTPTSAGSRRTRPATTR